MIKKDNFHIIVFHFIFPIPFVFLFYSHGEIVGWQKVIDNWFLYLLMFIGGQSLAGMFSSLISFENKIYKERKDWNEYNNKWREKNLNKFSNKHFN